VGAISSETGIIFLLSDLKDKRQWLTTLHCSHYSCFSQVWFCIRWTC